MSRSHARAASSGFARDDAMETRSTEPVARKRPRVRLSLSLSLSRSCRLLPALREDIVLTSLVDLRSGASARWSNDRAMTLTPLPMTTTSCIPSLLILLTASSNDRQRCHWYSYENMIYYLIIATITIAFFNNVRNVFTDFAFVILSRYEYLNFENKLPLNDYFLHLSRILNILSIFEKNIIQSVRLRDKNIKYIQFFVVSSFMRDLALMIC